MRFSRIAYGVFILFLVSIFTSNAFSAYRPLKGSYAVTSKNLVDPAPREKKDRIVFFLEGKSALDMYSGMAGKEEKDACSEDLLTKRSGGLTCSKEVGKEVYTCTFGIMLKGGFIVNSEVC